MNISSEIDVLTVENGSTGFLSVNILSSIIDHNNLAHTITPDIMMHGETMDQQDKLEKRILTNTCGQKVAAAIG